MEPQPTPLPQATPPNVFSKVLLFFIILFSFVATFAGGYFFKGMLKEESTSSTTPPIHSSPSPQITPLPTKESDTTLFLPGKTYFDDTLIAITKNAPHIAVVISARRSETDNGFVQSTGFSFFNGEKWSREQDSSTNKTSEIMTNSLIKSWETTIDPSRVLKQSITTNLTIQNKNISVQSTTLQNEISMRSLPGYTKFMSNAIGTITIDGKVYESNILYTRIYSLNATDIQFYDTPLGVKTYWVAFWDNENNFYHIDTTTVSKPTDIYKTHQIAVEETNTGAVYKSFTVPITSDSKNPPSLFSVNTNTPSEAVLTLNRKTLLNKAPNNSYTWIMGTVEGTVVTKDSQSRDGFGLVEYIQD